MIAQSDSAARRRPGASSPSNAAAAILTNEHAADAPPRLIQRSRSAATSVRSFSFKSRTTRNAAAICMILSGAICLMLVSLSFLFSATTFRTSTIISPPPRPVMESKALMNRLRTHKSSNATKAPAKLLQHRHAIPNVFIFTHAINLLTATFDYADTTPRESLSGEQKELLALQQNVRNITALHHRNNYPTPQVRFLTDDDCMESIRAVYTHDTATASELIRYFAAETQGMYKADLCRGTALYQNGGVYLDVDLGVRLNLWSVLKESTEFATVKVHHQSKYPGAFFQAFTAATPQHPVIYRYVELFVQYYRGTLAMEPGPLGVLLLKRAYDEIQIEQEEQQQQAAALTTDPTHLNATTELWQEVLYLPKFQRSILSHVPPPKWGYRRACKFVVVVTSVPTKLPLTVPFYSRIAGSRMCPSEADMRLQQQEQEQPRNAELEDEENEGADEEEKDEVEEEADEEERPEEREDENDEKEEDETAK